MRTLLVLLALCAAPVHAETLDLFVLAGQSNMQGWMGDASGYPPDPENLDRSIRFWWQTPGYGSSRGKWTYLMPQGGRFAKGHFGPEVTFARDLAKAQFRPAVFKYSLTATSLAYDWRAPGEGGLYDRMVAALETAIRLLEGEGHTVKFRCLVWIQGESDAKTEEATARYQDHLRVLIAHFREHVARDRRLPVILGVDEHNPYVMQRPSIVESQKKLAETNPQIAFTSMTGLPKADATHLTPAGVIAHGHRLFVAFRQLSP